MPIVIFRYTNEHIKIFGGYAMITTNNEYDTKNDVGLRKN